MHADARTQACVRVCLHRVCACTCMWLCVCLHHDPDNRACVLAPACGCARGCTALHMHAHNECISNLLLELISNNHGVHNMNQRSVTVQELLSQKHGSHAFKPFDSYRAPGALSTWLALELAWLGLGFGLPTAGRMVASGTK